MGFQINLVSTIKRIDWIKDKYQLNEVIYMGDGIFDHYVMQKVGYSIATANSDTNAKKFSDYTTKRNGSERAVAEACLHIMKKFFKPYNPNKLLKNRSKLSGNWGA
jgi:3-deoxy-D-manno-octulosonate 8-phosphate phosphatase (KDO 8-P phosphatase)